ncbi:hypothetical protein NDU88_000178 [Pleurodeles waltl]|uniref:Uncharacterized protein n=1 Tax=Pleurodeles waltl TaxID=8319 RepID=A0AAV7VSR1_PLEWA|nr:hypothetical protein NDU88_000178 [Pleurodeles waltl]
MVVRGVSVPSAGRAGPPRCRFFVSPSLLGRAGLGSPALPVSLGPAAFGEAGGPHQFRQRTSPARALRFFCQTCLASRSALLIASRFRGLRCNKTTIQAAPGTCY